MWTSSEKKCLDFFGLLAYSLANWMFFQIQSQPTACRYFFPFFSTEQLGHQSPEDQAKQKQSTTINLIIWMRIGTTASQNYLGPAYNSNHQP